MLMWLLIRTLVFNMRAKSLHKILKLYNEGFQIFFK